MAQKKKKQEMYKLTKLQTRFVVVFASIIALAVVIIPIVLSLIEKKKENSITCRVQISTGISEVPDYYLNVSYGTKIEEIKTKLEEASGYYLISVCQDSSRSKALSDKDKIKKDQSLFLKYEFMLKLEVVENDYYVKGLEDKFKVAEKLSIPKAYNGKNIVGISNNAFASNPNLKSVTMSNNITFIGLNAFVNCKNLESVTLSSNLKTISNNAFLTCMKLKSITLPNSLETIGSSAFSNCMNLKEVSIPASVKSIGDAAFINCDNLNYLTINSAEIYNSDIKSLISSANIIKDFIKEIKVLKSIDTATNEYLNNNFKKVEEGEYNIYIKNLA